MMEEEGVALKHPKRSRGPTDDLAVAPLFGLEGRAIPRHELPRDEMSPDVAYQIIHDELMLDGNARLNVATFVTTWMEPQAERLMAECVDKNMIDKDEYPQTAELESRCVAMLSRLWHAPEAEAANASGRG
jgi:glutamate decarboxylase